jgi:hypothetical protein
MTIIREMLSTLLGTGTAVEAPSSPRPESRVDRLDRDVIGLSDSDAMWYYERRNWRGRD